MHARERRFEIEELNERDTFENKVQKKTREDDQQLFRNIQRTNTHHGTARETFVVSGRRGAVQESTGAVKEISGVEKL